MEMTMTIQEMENRIKELEAKNVELIETIKYERNINIMADSQQTLTLKTVISNSLRFEYYDYLHDKNAEYDPDMFAALKGSLTRIFKVLKRNGIKFE